MQNQIALSNNKEGLHFGHFGLIFLTAVLLIGASYMKDPSMFNFHPAAVAVDPALVPHYYAYVTPPEDQQPLVAGASTNGPGVSIINEDGSVTPVDTGSVLGASTKDVQLSLDQVPVKQIPDSDAAIKQYFSDSQNIEGGYINNADFQTTLISGDQKQIDAQADKLTGIINNLEALPVPQSLVHLQKLKIVQYQAGVGLLHNFTQADNNPTLVGQYLDQFLKSQQEMDDENLAAEQKFGVDLGITIPTATASTAALTDQTAVTDQTALISGDLTGSSDPLTNSDYGQ